MRDTATARSTLLVLGLLLSGGAAAHDGHHAPAPAAASGLAVPAGVKMGGEFELVNQDGRPARLGAPAPRQTLVVFGFTACGATCPSALAELTRLTPRLPPEAMPAIVFVTLDPARDTPQALRDYLGAFDAQFVGLTGTPAQIQRVADAYKVAAHKVPEGDGYTIEHSAYTYLLDESGRVIRLYRYGTPAEVIGSELLRIAPLRAASR